MKVRKFTAISSREALRKVKDALGADAVILSNRHVDGLVEIMAMDDHSLTEISPQNLSKDEVNSITKFTPKGINFSQNQKGQNEENLSQIENHSISKNEMMSVMNEIRSMRGALESSLAEISWTNTQKRSPQKAEILKEMLATGFSASLSRLLVEKLPENQLELNGLEWIKAVLSRNLSVISNESEILEKGGVYALVGPTGVGKTTTTAKLAARCVMRHGPSKLALITTDAYRIGGYEQLRIYGKILGVMVHSVKDEADLKIALSELKNKHTVLIDTVGVSQRDKMVTEQVAMLSSTGVPVKRLLCLNATSNGETLSEVVRAYQGNGLSGCIITKLDEAATIGGVLDIAIRHKLQMYYVASGQRVPEDLHVANKQYLVDRAFKLKRETAAYKFHNDELSLLMSDLGLRSLTQTSNQSKELSLG